METILIQSNSNEGEEYYILMPSDWEPIPEEPDFQLWEDVFYYYFQFDLSKVVVEYKIARKPYICHISYKDTRVIVPIPDGKTINNVRKGRRRIGYLATLIYLREGNCKGVADLLLCEKKKWLD